MPRTSWLLAHPANVRRGCRPSLRDKVDFRRSCLSFISRALNRNFSTFRHVGDMIAVERVDFHRGDAGTDAWNCTVLGASRGARSG